MKPNTFTSSAAALVFLLGTGFSAHAVTINDFESRTFASSLGETIRYRLFTPDKYDPSRSYPIVIFLHGGQQKGKAKWTGATVRGAKFCAEESRQAKHPCFVLVPTAPLDENWGSVFEGGPSPTLLGVIEALGALEDEFNIDKRREYITGLSGGGKGTWIAFLSHPGRFAAAIPLCARQAMDPETADMSKYALMAKDLPIWMWHGAKDPKNEAENSRQMFKALQSAGGDVQYTEVPDAPHNCWDAAYSTDELHEWFFDQTLPESISAQPEARARRRDAVSESNPWQSIRDHPSGFIPRTYTHPTRGRLNYRLFMPEDYDRGRSYPLVVFLHGKGRKGSDNLKQINTAGAMVWTTPEIQSENPCFVLAPQAPGDSGWGCPAILPEMMDPIQNVAAVIDFLDGKLNIDQRRIYIAGQSGGGGGASTLIMTQPERFAAAVLVCPANREQNWKPEQAALIADMPIWFFHGAVDPIVPVDMTRAAVKLLKDAGGNPKYTEYPKQKHDCWKKAFPTAELHQWLFSQELPESAAASDGEN